MKLKQTIERIVNDNSMDLIHAEAVSGGDINESFHLQTNKGDYFLKINDAYEYPALFKHEAEGLLALRENSDLRVPDVKAQGMVDRHQYLLLEFIVKWPQQKGFWEKFGREVAKLHFEEYYYFGWQEDNYIGTIKQCNTQHILWSDFYVKCRLEPLIRTLFERDELDTEDLKNAEHLYKKMPEIFPVEHPSLLHGDLWSGNFMADEKNQAVIYDPAVYYGHREMDLGMTKLFGGFEKEFYQGYNDVYPLENGWEERLPYSQLYPILAHGVLFGGSYIEQVKGILKRHIS